MTRRKRRKADSDPVKAAENVAFRLREMLDLRPSEVDAKSFIWGMELGIYALSYQTDMETIVPAMGTDALLEAIRFLVEDAGAVSMALLTVENILTERAKSEA